MAKNKQYRFFLKNYWLVIYLWLFGGLILIVGLALISINLPWWVILLIVGASLCFIIGGIVTTITLRCRIDADGITVPSSHGRKRLLFWDDISSVQIICSNAYIKFQTAYIMYFQSDNFTVKLKTYKEIVDKIKEFSKTNERFQSIFLKSLCDAEK